MDTTTILIATVALAGAYWFYSNNKQNNINKTMYAKHDKPMERQKLGGMLNTAQSRHNTQKSMLHNPLGSIDDRYIKTV